MSEEPPRVARALTPVKQELAIAVNAIDTAASADLEVKSASPPSRNSAPDEQQEITIVRQGWLVKQSRGGLPNWNRRWFMLIGGSLYYSKTDSPDMSNLSVFTELQNGIRVEMDQSSGSENGFKLARCIPNLSHLCANGRGCLTFVQRGPIRPPS